jgi:hypothetical protein
MGFSIFEGRKIIMQIRCDNLPWSLDKKFIQILNDTLATTEADDGVTITFRDPDFTPETGGFFPVEVSISKDAQIQYITDFCYVGQPPMCDLCKCLDFDFSLKRFQHYSMDSPINTGREVFQLWQSNFIAYHNINAYTVEIEPW